VAELDAIRWLQLTDADVERVRAAVGEVLAGQPQVVAAYHYGSSARRQPARDIDIGLVVDRAAMRSLDVDAIAANIAVACGRGVDQLDVRVVNDADSVFLGNLMREGVRCYERDLDGRVAFEVQAMNSWLDFQPVWDRMRKRVLKVWSHG
jgi:predicted nucleotidyltransferase